MKEHTKGSFMTFSGACILALGLLIFGFESYLVAEDTLPPLPRSLPNPEVTSGDSGVQTVPDPATGRIRPKAPHPGPKYVVTSVDLNNAAKTGLYVGVFGGMSITQDEIFAGRGIKINGGEASWEGDGVAPMAGFKFGYMWPFVDDPIDQFELELGKPSIRLSGSLEFEMYYLSSDVDLGSGVNNVIEIDSAVFALNAFLVGQYKNWKFYIGPGVGAAWTHIDEYPLALATDGKDGDDGLGLVYQGIGGIEYAFSEDRLWAFFTEARYVGLSRLEFFGGVSQLQIQQIDQLIVNIGVKKYF